MPTEHIHKLVGPLTLHGQLDLMRSMSAGDRSIIAVEAMWQDHWPVSWREAYETTRDLHGQGTATQIACLEIMMATQAVIDTKTR